MPAVYLQTTFIIQYRPRPVFLFVAGIAQIVIDLG